MYPSSETSLEGDIIFSGSRREQKHWTHIANFEKERQNDQAFYILHQGIVPYLNENKVRDRRTVCSMDCIDV